MLYPMPGSKDALFSFKNRYENFIGGQWVAPKAGQYFDNISPVTGQVFCEVPRSTAADLHLALDAAHAAADAWGKTPAAERSNVLLRIADRIEANLETLAYVETWDNGKGIRETLNADLPLLVDQFRYFAGCIRAQEGSAVEIDSTTVCYHFHEPLGVVGQIIPWNFPLLMAGWKLAPALAAGNCVVLKPAEQTPVSVLVMMEMIADLLPPGVVNILNGYGEEIGQALATSNRIAKIAFTGSTAVGQIILGNAAKSLIPSTVELGGKSPNIFFEDIMCQEDDFISKCVEGVLLGFFNQGEVCTCPSRALVQESIYGDFIERVLLRAKNIKQGNPLDTDTMVGAQVSLEQFERIMGYMDVARNEGAHFLMGGGKAAVGSDIAGGYYIQPTLLQGTNDMRVFQEEIFGPTLGVTTFRNEAEALAIANATEYGLGAGVWTRDTNRAFRMGRGIKAGRVWLNCYHAYPAHAAFGGYKKSGIGREGHKMALEHYQQTKNMLVSHDINPLGFFDLTNLYRAVIASVLLGAGAVFLCLYLVYAWHAYTHVPTPAWKWDFTNGKVKVGSGNGVRQGWQLTLDETGQGVVVLPLPLLKAHLYPLLRLQFSDQPAPHALAVFWRTVQTGEQMAQYGIPGSLQQQLWLPMGGMNLWAGDLVELAVLVSGAPGDEFVIEAVELLPASPHNQLRAFLSDWNSFVPWGLHSINHYQAARSAGVTLYPVPLIAALLTASLFAYGVLLLVLESLRFDWRVVSVIFIVCWLSLDLSWQGKLWRQLEITYSHYAGKTSDAKLLAGPDAALVQFMSDVAQRIASAETRVFVASRDDYSGMRGSYYLYPLNVFWQRSGPELPAAKYIRSGDYIVLINPTALLFETQDNTLLTPDMERISVKWLGSSGLGSLFLVN